MHVCIYDVIESETCKRGHLKQKRGAFPNPLSIELDCRYDTRALAYDQTHVNTSAYDGDLCL